MRKIVSIIMILALIGSGFILSDIGNSNVQGNEIPTRSGDYFAMDMNISEVALASFIGEAPGDWAGFRVSGAGDVNGDGNDDILIGARYNDEGGSRAGQAYLIFGQSTGMSIDMNLSSADASFIGEAEGNELGISVAGAGDVNGDGYDDILIGAPGNSEGVNGAGQTYLIFGKSTGWSMDMNLSSADASFIGEALHDGTGYYLAGAGDVNGDGYDDFLIGVGDSSGTSYLILGQSTGWTRDTSLSNADASFYSIGFVKVAGAGDVNGDGYDDILIGIRNNHEGGTSAGQTYLVFGKETGWSMNTDLNNVDASFIGENLYDYSGCSVSGAGDVNGDGYDDILIGANGNDEGGSNAGQTYLVLGKASGWSMDTDIEMADASFIGETVEDNSSFFVAGAGDVNDDGFDDILIGAYGNDEGGVLAGQTYLVLGKSSGWSMDKDLSDADASFIGEASNDNFGVSVSGAGDVNGDGCDDLLIGAMRNDEGGEEAGQIYLISDYGYSEPLEVYSVDLFSDSGFSTSATVSDIGDNIYLELKGLDSNASNMDTALVNITSRPGSFGLIRVRCVETGLNTGIYRGVFKVPLRTLYLDTLNFSSRKDPTKFDTLFIDHPYRPTSISLLKTYYDDQYSIEADKVEIGENIYIEVIGADANSISRNLALVNISTELSIQIPYPLILQETNINTGIYRTEFKVPENFIWLENIRLTSCRDPIIFTDVTVDIPFRPTSIDSLKVCSDSSYSKEVDKVQWYETFYIEVVGQDANDLTQNKAIVNITSDDTFQIPIVLPIHETGINTGVYRGLFTIPNSTKMLEKLIIYSVRDPSKKTEIMICTLVKIEPEEPIRVVDEDEEYRVQYSNLGYADISMWTYDINCDWLTFDTDTLVLFGTPDNEDVGIVSVSFNLSDDFGHYDVQEFMLKVNNSSPQLFGTDVLEIDQDEYYEVDYNCDDDGKGVMTYHVSSNADWLEMEPRNGTLFGLPDNDNVGEYTVTVSVTDGNDGWDSSQFNLTVHNINDAPVILTDDIYEVTQNDPFVRNYVAEDIDLDDELRWELHSDALFLSVDSDTGKLTGEPGYADVGNYFVNISVWDLSDDFDFHNFTLTVIDINDQAVWNEFPENTEIIHGRTYLFDVNATDYDGDELTYSISSTPDSEITIDEETGLINWTADIHLFNQAPYKLEVKVSVWDGLFYLNRTFTITITATEPPVVELLGPSDGTKGASTGALLTWEGTDPEDEPITYNIYLHQTEAFVQGYREEALYMENYEGDNITLSSLDPGKTYFWTVIPNDGCSDGVCTSGVMSFRVNYKPTFKAMEDHEVPAGTDFKYKISATDEDSEDLPNLKYSLAEAPDGMTISEETGMIRWTPKDNQVMLHTVTVMVSDGIENTTATFEIEVTEGESDASSLFLIIIIVVVVVILLAVGIFFFIKQKKKVDEEALKKGEEERAALEKEREDEYASYEDLYGVPAPEVDDDGVTTSELKDYIHEKIQEIEE